MTRSIRRQKLRYINPMRRLGSNKFCSRILIQGEDKVSDNENELS
jgi:hypothetical protein